MSFTFRQFLEANNNQTIIEMANRWIPKIKDPESDLEFQFSCIGATGEKLEIINCMDDNNDWSPVPLVRHWLEKQVGAMRDDYALRFKYCLWKGTPYIAAYFSGIHYVFKVVK